MYSIYSKIKKYNKKSRKMQIKISTFPISSILTHHSLRSQWLVGEMMIILVLIQMLADYFSGDHDFNLLCSVFMIIFMVQGRDVEYKVSSLSRLLSYSLSVNAVSILTLEWLSTVAKIASYICLVQAILVEEMAVVMKEWVISWSKVMATEERDRSVQNLWE